MSADSDGATPSAHYLALDDEAQVQVLREAALEAALGFDLVVRDLTLVLHAYNTTFRVDTADGRRLALRVNTNSHSTAENVVAQQEWLHAIAAEGRVRVPDPLRAPDGRWAVEVTCPGWGGLLRATAASWLPGDDLGTCDPVQARALGEAMALLHDQAERFVVPRGGDLPVFDEPLFGDDDLLTDHPDLPQGGRAVVAAALDDLREVCRRVSAAGPAIVIHGDLHGGNLKWHQGQLAIFDVDDCGIGVPALDVAIATFYLRSGEPGDAAVEAALRTGYSGIRALPTVSGEDFEALVATRQVLLANSLLASTTAALRAEAVAYLSTTVDRLAHWQSTGRFSLHPACR